MNTRIRAGIILATSAAALIQTSAFGTDFIKLQNTTALNLPGAWNSTGDADGIPDADDTLIWDSTVTAVNARTVGSLSALGGDLSVLGVTITNVGGAVNAANTAIGFQNPGSANTLTIGAGGINMTLATQNFYVESRLALSANQTWIVTNANSNNSATGFNNGEDLSLRSMSGSTSSSPTPFNLGGFALTVSGNGNVTVSSGYNVTNGTINVNNSLFLISGGDSRLVTVGPDVNLNVANGSTLHFQSNSAGVTSSANIALNGGTLKLVSNSTTNQVIIGGTTTVNTASTLQVGNTFTGGGTLSNNGIVFNSNLTGSAPLAVTNNAGRADVLIFGGNNSAYSGTLTFGGTAGRVTRLTTANSGSAAATWDVSAGHNLEINGVTVSLGTLSGAGAVASSSGAATINVGSGSFSGTITNGSGTVALTKTGSGTLDLTGGNTYTGATQVNAGTLLVSPTSLGATAVAVANAATFGIQAATSGTLSTPTISVADGGTLLVRPLAADASVAAPSVAVGTTTGGTIVFDNSAFGNPTSAPLVATAFAPADGTTVRVVGANLAPGIFPVIGYTTLAGAGFDGLDLELPFRVSGSLLNSPGTIDLNITNVGKPTWRAALNANWDIDTVGNGSAGTANWFASAGPQTYVEAPAIGSDSVIFDDTATGTTNVNITTTVSPGAITVNNTAQDYTFSGTGKISGSAPLTKAGTRALTIANTGINDFSGGTTINEGTVRVGDGTTAGAGTLGTGGVSVGSLGTFELNRPDDFTLANAVTSSGVVTKSQANTATISVATNLNGPLNVNAGALRFTGGGTISAPVSGAGELQSAGGTLALTGSTPNTNTSVTTISAGTLQLRKDAGVNAVGGDILITGSGVLAIQSPEQIPDTATIVFTGTSADSTAGTNSMETVANVICNPVVDTGQFQLRIGFTVTGTATLNNGVLGVSSGSTATANAINMTGGILRIAGNSAASTLNVGPGGITASGGEIQVKFNTNEQSAELNLGGNFTATGNVAITNANFSGASVNAINLTDTRAFNIADGTTTTVSPDIAGPGGLVKTGTGTLSLTNLSSGFYTGPTVIEAGTFAIAGGLSGTSSIIVKQGATFDASTANFGLALGQTLGGSGSILGPITIGTGALLAPGDTTGTLTFNGALNLELNVTPPSSTSLAFELASPGASDKVAFASGALSIGTAVLDFGDFAFTKLPGLVAGEYTLFDGISPIIGTLDADPANLTGSLGDGVTGTIGFGDGGNDLVLTVVPEPGSAALLLGGLAWVAGSRRIRRRVS